MRKSKLFLLLFLLFSVFVSSSCSCFGFQEDEEEKIEFSIEASSTTYYLGDGYITIRPTSDSVFDTEYNYNKRIEYFIVGEDNVESTLKSSGDTGLFIANKRGSIKIQAKYKDVLSTNVIEIVCDFRNEDVSGSIENILNKNLVLGASYYIGLDSDLGISLSGGEGIIELNEDCELEVIGVGAGTITIKKNNDVLYEGPYNIERSENILLVLNDLLDLGCGFPENEDSNICNGGITGLSINPYGIVYPCGTLKLEFGNLKKQSLEDILNNSFNRKKLLKIKSSEVKCSKNCKYKKTCVFCPGQALLEKGDLVSKYEEACLIAKIAYSLKKGKEATR